MDAQKPKPVRNPTQAAADTAEYARDIAWLEGVIGQYEWAYRTSVDAGTADVAASLAAKLIRYRALLHHARNRPEGGLGGHQP